MILLICERYPWEKERGKEFGLAFSLELSITLAGQKRSNETEKRYCSPEQDIREHAKKIEKTSSVKKCKKKRTSSRKMTSCPKEKGKVTTIFDITLPAVVDVTLPININSLFVFVILFIYT